MFRLSTDCCFRVTATVPLVKLDLMYPGHWRVYHFYHITVRHDLVLSLSPVIHASPLSWEPAMHASLVSLTPEKHKNYWIIHWIFKNICFLICPSRPGECLMKKVDGKNFVALSLSGKIVTKIACTLYILASIFPNISLLNNYKLVSLSL